MNAALLIIIMIAISEHLSKIKFMENRSNSYSLVGPEEFYIVGQEGKKETFQTKICTQKI